MDDLSAGMADIGSGSIDLMFNLGEVDASSSRPIVILTHFIG